MFLETNQLGEGSLEVSPVILSTLAPIQPKTYQVFNSFRACAEGVCRLMMYSTSLSLHECALAG